MSWLLLVEIASVPLLEACANGNSQPVRNPSHAS
jgi:hypothetical protein